MQILDSLIQGALAQPKKADQKEIIYQLVKYLATGEAPEMNSAAVRSYFLTTMPVLKKSRARIEAGKHSGEARVNKTGNKTMNKTMNKTVNKTEANEGTNVQTNRKRNRSIDKSIRDIREIPPIENRPTRKNEPKYQEIIDCLNHFSGSSFRSTTKKTRELINARFNEGYTQEDFDSVIAFKCRQWRSDPKMCAYMRPETLFGTKFEGYLQEAKAVHNGSFDAYNNG